MEAIIAALCGLLGVIVTKFIDYRISKNKEESENSKRLTSIENRLSSLEENTLKEEIDNLRTQLLVMISDYPNEVNDILRLGERYFNELKGNWVLSDIFKKWAVEKNVSIPVWMEDEK